jgi:hypothetical protein
MVINGYNMALLKGNKLLFFLLCVLLFSCKRERSEDELSLSLQRIPSSSKVIYVYSYDGKYAWSSAEHGKVILDSTEVFTWKKSRNKLPLFIMDIKGNEFHCIKFIDPKKNGKKEKYQKKYDGIKLIVKDVFSIEGSNMNFFYKYGNFYETTDSIFFENLSVDFGILLPSTTGFKKGDIIAIEDSCGYVTNFFIEVISTYPLYEKFRRQDTINMADTENFLYINFDDLPALSSIYEFNITLTPDSASIRQKVSDYGIFKNVNIRERNRR